MITSPANPKLRYVHHLRRRVFRAREGRWLLEGVRLVEDALAAGVVPAFVLVRSGVDEVPGETSLWARLEAAGAPILEVAPPLFDAACDTVHPQGVLAVVPAPVLAWPAAQRLVLILDGVRDPGNVGTVLRAALAAGADGVLLAPGTADAGNPKVVRAAMGAHFRLPVLSASWEGIEERAAGLTLWLADASGDVPYSAVDWRAPVAVVVGGEAAGPGPEARRLAHGSVRIPMAGPADSLNAAMAATVLLFEAARQQSLTPAWPAALATKGIPEDGSAL